MVMVSSSVTELVLMLAFISALHWFVVATTNRSIFRTEVLFYCFCCTSDYIRTKLHPFTGNYERFRRLLVEARKAAGLTQVELSTKLSRPQSYVSKYERGERRLDVIEFLDVARVLGIDESKFLKKLDAPSSR